jgi:hypothetical protein
MRLQQSLSVPVPCVDLELGLHETLDLLGCEGISDGEIRRRKKRWSYGDDGRNGLRPNISNVKLALPLAPLLSFAFLLTTSALLSPPCLLSVSLAAPHQGQWDWRSIARLGLQRSHPPQRAVGSRGCNRSAIAIQPHEHNLS